MCVVVCGQTRFVAERVQLIRLKCVQRILVLCVYECTHTHIAFEGVYIIEWNVKCMLLFVWSRCLCIHCPRHISHITFWINGSGRGGGVTGCYAISTTTNFNRQWRKSFLALKINWYMHTNNETITIVRNTHVLNVKNIIALAIVVQ